jgi:hypothetical protein
MKRRKRRTAKEFNVVIDYGRLQDRDPNNGLLVACYACDAPHLAEGVACIVSSGRANFYVPLCETCLATDDKGHRIYRKFLGEPDFEIAEGDKITAEQFAALVEKIGGGGGIEH